MKCRKLILGMINGWECRSVTIWSKHGVIFHLGSSAMFCSTIFEAYFSYHKDVWSAATGYY